MRNEVGADVSGSVVQAGTVHGGIHLHANTGYPAVPAQLPASRPYFTDRARELEMLRRLGDAAREQAAVIVISGVGGVGKTSLALAWLHRVVAEFVDGQLFADLRGFSAGAPATPSESLGRFLRALGVAPEAVPADLDEQAALFRTLTAERRLIILLDNAASAAQVRPLLPGRGPSVVAVTSRRRLSGLAVDGASFLPLDPLDETGAVELLDRMLGTGRTAAEPQAVRSLTALCGRLPLALCTSAARLATRGHWRIERLVGELADERRRLAVLGEEDLSVQAVFDVTYRDLPPSAARLYRLMSVHPNGWFGLPAATAAAGGDPDDTARDLDALVDVNLVDAASDGRFRFHDLAHLHARSVADQAAHEAEKEQAFHRLMDHYLGMAVAADRAIIPDRWHLGRKYQEPPAVPFSGTPEAIGWIEAELPLLRDLIADAHERGLHRDTWEMCEALWGVLTFRKHYAIWIETHEKGHASAVALGDPVAQARMLEALAVAQLNLGDFPAAARLGREALVLERDAGHREGEVTALECLGVAQMAQGDVATATETFTRALAVSRGVPGDAARSTAMMTRRLGEALVRDGRSEAGAGRLREALGFFTGRGDDYNRARTLSALAEALLADGLDAEAGEALAEAAEAAARVGARHSLANIHAAQARLAARQGDPAAERGHLEQAAAVFEELGSYQARAIRERLAELGGP
ncbi:ATP-binding protein [Actinomadura sp. 3N508]|uniref:ATP-binding protein n=1 Tax=Actinomadura sp. 3N508 TaxID=3375153 RepID=UPI00378BDCEF